MHNISFYQGNVSQQPAYYATQPNPQQYYSSTAAITPPTNSNYHHTAAQQFFSLTNEQGVAINTQPGWNWNQNQAFDGVQSSTDLLFPGGDTNTNNQLTTQTVMVGMKSARRSRSRSSGELRAGESETRSSQRSRPRSRSGERGV